MNEEEIKKGFLESIKNYGEKIALGFILLCVLGFVYLALDRISNSDKQKQAIQPVTDPKYFMNLESDTSRLECVFEQRRCYFNNLGFPKEEATTRCGSINFCDEKFKVKK